MDMPAPSLAVVSEEGISVPVPGSFRFTAPPLRKSFSRQLFSCFEHFPMCFIHFFPVFSSSAIFPWCFQGGGDVNPPVPVPGVPVTKEEIIRKAELVESVYDSIELGENKYNGYSVFGKSHLLQKVGLKSQFRTSKISRYLYMTAKGTIFGSGTNWVGYVAIDDSVQKQRNIVVVFRGTMTKAEWWKDFDTAKTQFPFVGETCEVHSGFNSMYSSKDPSHPFGDKSLRDQVIDELTVILADTPKDKKVKITIAGHSLGGALTALAACDIGYNFALQKNIPVSAFTFGSPKVGAESFKKIVEGFENVGILRFENVGDVVPRVPFEIEGYVAVGILQTVDYTTSQYVKPLTIKQVGNKHDLELYMHGISLEPGVASLDNLLKEMGISTSSSVEDLSHKLTEYGDQTAVDQLESLKSLFRDEEGKEDTESLHLYLLQCVYVRLSQTLRPVQEDPGCRDYVLVNKRQDSLKSTYEVPDCWWIHSNNDVRQDSISSKWLPRSYRPQDDPIPSNPEYN